MDEEPNKRKKIPLKLTDYSSASDLGNRVGFVKYGQDGWGRDLYSMQQVIAVQSKFPVKIREKINRASRWDPEQFFQCMESAMKLLFGFYFDDIAMNSEVDTEKEVEYAIRVFPSIMGSGCYYPGLNAIRFYPLVTELYTEYRLHDVVTLDHLVQCFCFVSQMAKYEGEDIDIKVNETFHSILLRLKENCMVKASDVEIRRSVHILLGGCSFQSEKMLHLLLDWEPALLEEFPTHKEYGFGYEYRSPLLHYFVEDLVYFYPDDDKSDGNGSDGSEAIWMGFKTLFELGITHYPKELGFVFHNFDFKTSRYFRTSEQFRRDLWRDCPDILSIQNPFGVLCHLYGKERVTKYVMEILLKLFRGCSYGMQTLLLSLVDDPNIEVDTLYYLLRSDPSSLIPANL